MNKSDKIRAYFRKHPDADVAKVAAKFEAPKPMTYKLRKQVQEEWNPPEMVPMPEVPKQIAGGRRVTLGPAQLAIAKKLGIPLDKFVEKGLKSGLVQYDDEREVVGEETDIDETLDERAQDYGKFKDGAALMQALKRTLADHARIHNKTFSDDQWEALEMIVHKIGRIVNGNPDKVDHWVDIAGYAKLVADRLQGNAR
ncbi:MAG: DUF6378 domain-containing protein [Burkholderiaceae bacterium]